MTRSNATGTWIMRCHVFGDRNREQGSLLRKTVPPL